MIKLKPLGMEHLEWSRLLHNDPDVLRMLTDPHEVSVEEQFVWFGKLQNSKTSQRLVAILDGAPIGVVRLDQIDHYNKSICVGLDIHKAYRGKGHAKPIYELIFKDWFEQKEFNRIWLMVASYNERAIKMYNQLGFVYEGTQVEALLKDGKFHDYFMMSILRREWFSSKEEKDD